MVPGAASARVRRLPATGRSVVWVEVEDSIHKGALSAEASQVITGASILALDKRLPLVLCVASSGADIVEGIPALHGWGQAARAISDCSGVVPTIAIVNGPAVSGPALLIGLCDIVVMTAASYAFVAGPTMVAQFTGITVSNEELGGADSHMRHSGVACFVEDNLDAAIERVEDVLTYMP